MTPGMDNTEVLLVSAAPKKRSNAQLARDARRAAQRNAADQTALRRERREEQVLSDRVNPFLAGRKDARQRELDARKLGLRQDVRGLARVVENENFIGPISRVGRSR